MQNYFSATVEFSPIFVRILLDATISLEDIIMLMYIKLIETGKDNNLFSVTSHVGVTW